MQIELDGILFDVFITRKNNKNMYLRIKPDGIYISCNYFVTKGMIISFIVSNKDSIIKTSEKLRRKEKKKEEFYYLGKKYNVILSNTIKKIEFIDDNIYVKNKTYLNTFLKKECERVFSERLDICYNLFEEDIPYPKLTIGHMTRKWGYNNKAKKTIKLNSELIKYSINEIDYVIIHELSHLIEFNHSRKFWSIVKKYKPDYKENQMVLKEE